MIIVSFFAAKKLSPQPALTRIKGKERKTPQHGPPHEKISWAKSHWSPYLHLLVSEVSSVLACSFSESIRNEGR